MAVQRNALQTVLHCKEDAKVLSSAQMLTANGICATAAGTLTARKIAEAGAHCNRCTRTMLNIRITIKTHCTDLTQTGVHGCCVGVPG